MRRSGGVQFGGSSPKWVPEMFDLPRNSPCVITSVPASTADRASLQGNRYQSKGHDVADMTRLRVFGGAHFGAERVNGSGSPP
jgi:hypothetical protein